MNVNRLLYVLFGVLAKDGCAVVFRPQEPEEYRVGLFQRFWVFQVAPEVGAHPHFVRPKQGIAQGAAPRLLVGDVEEAVGSFFHISTFALFLAAGSA